MAAGVVSPVGVRALLATLNGRADRDTLREAAPQWSATLAGCKNYLAQVPFSEKTWAAVLAVVNDADAACNERNRYMHDLLVETIAADDQARPDAAAYDGKRPRLRVRLASDRKGIAPDAQVVSLEPAVALV